jgi:predicted AlkP superfamily phosphohydrolase/phosphomutase
MRWISILCLSGAGSVAAVRLAVPTALDEKLSVLALFFLLPAPFVLLLRSLSKALGLALALAIPFIWVAVSRDSGDSVFLWLVPAITCAFVIGAARRYSSGGLRMVVALASLAVAASAVLWPATLKPGPGPKVVVIGLDGASWDLVDPFVARGRLPNIERLEEHGHRARLRTLNTMLSPQIWSTIATGCTPDVHGMLDFAYKQDNFRVGRIWDRLKQEGRSFGLCGWYFTWPPTPGIKDKDFIIPSRYAPDDRVFPPKYSFYRQVEGWVRTGERRGFRTGLRSYASAGVRAWRRGIRLSTLRMGIFEVLGRRLTSRRELDDHWRARRISVALQGDLFAELLRDRSPEFAAVLFTQIDHVSHKYWKYMAPKEFSAVHPADAEKYGGVIEAIYAQVDRAIGEILEVVPEDADVLIVSDHGFQALHQTDAETHCRIRTEGLIDVLGLNDKVFGTNVDEEVYLRGIDAKREDRMRVIEGVENVLLGTHIVGESRQLFDVTLEDEVLHLHLASRPAVPEDAKVILGGAEYPFGSIVRARREAFNSGGHHPFGVYLLSGPAAAHSVAADSLHVLDVAPTLAALLRLPISPLWPGRPAIEGVSIAELGVAEYPPPSEPAPPPTHIDEALKARLRALGYLE